MPGISRRPQASRQRYRAFVDQYHEKNRKREARVPKEQSGEEPPSHQLYFRSYLRWLWPYRYTVALLFALALLGTALQIVQPLCARYIVDRILLNRALTAAIRFRHLTLAGLSFLLLIVLYSAIGSVRDYRQYLFKAHAMLALRRAMLERLLHLPLSKLWNIKVGGILSRLTGDVETTSDFMELALVSISSSAFRLLFGVALLTVLNWRLALGAMALIPPAVLLSFFLVKRVRPIYQSSRHDEERIDGCTAETFAGIRVVRAFRRERFELLKYMRERNTVARKELFAQRRERFTWTFWDLLIGMMNVGISWYGGYLVLQGRASIGDILTFQWYTFLLLNPVWSIVSSLSHLQRSLASMQRVFDVLTLEQDKPDRPDAREAPSIVHELRFEEVEFAYREGHPVVRTFNVVAHSGSVIALVGASGAGKTTVTDLVARFHDPTSGRILLNGCDIRDFKVSSYRKLTAVVQQEPFLFDGSVRDNISYSRHDATDAEIESAARQANAHEFIVNLPEGYETSVGERGVKLSGGQQQRLAIARALLASSQILILDEATSNLDVDSERLIQASLATLFEGRIAFVIAHRLSTVYRANLILVMKDGLVIERGNHDALMRAHGTYYNMVTRQAEFHKYQTAFVC